ncbi:hypothetical protein GOODEAATRI_028709 [Goodea atripinnis]|uniref:Uncharacterized protein n=1 Tax=Goodea atripinnis TaxID=208336 RepID=A0ABV0PHZ5_9TELE
MNRRGGEGRTGIISPRGKIRATSVGQRIQRSLEFDFTPADMETLKVKQIDGGDPFTRMKTTLVSLKKSVRNQSVVLFMCLMTPLNSLSLCGRQKYTWCISGHHDGLRH